MTQQLSLSPRLFHISNTQDDQARHVGRNLEFAVYSEVFFLEIPGDNEQNDEMQRSGYPLLRQTSNGVVSRIQVQFTATAITGNVH